MTRHSVGSERPIRDRVLEPEMMDDPGLDPGRHLAALRGLARINRISLAWRGLSTEIRRVHERAGRPVRIVDVAGGGGDVLLRAVAAAGVPTEPLLVDISDVAIDSAQRRARRMDLSLDVVRCDVLAGALPQGDLLCCTLFLHHLERHECVRLLTRMRAAAEFAIFVNDLRWSGVGTLLARIVPRLVTRSDVVHTDAVLSARAAWTTDELGGMATEAGLSGATVRSVIPCRMEMRWRRPT